MAAENMFREGQVQLKVRARICLRVSVHVCVCVSACASECVGMRVSACVCACVRASLQLLAMGSLPEERHAVHWSSSWVAREHENSIRPQHRLQASLQRLTLNNHALHVLRDGIEIEIDGKGTHNS